MNFVVCREVEGQYWDYYWTKHDWLFATHSFTMNWENFCINWKETDIIAISNNIFKKKLEITRQPCLGFNYQSQKHFLVLLSQPLIFSINSWLSSFSVSHSNNLEASTASRKISPFNPLQNFKNVSISNFITSMQIVPTIVTKPPCE